MEVMFSRDTDTKHRTGKFTKLLRDNSIPTAKTIACINRKVYNFEKLFNAPLWDALYCAENSVEDVAKLLEIQDLDVIACLFQAKRDSTGNLSRKEINASDVEKILKIGSISALSSLILLRIEFNKQFCHVSKYQLERHINALFVNLCTLNVIPCMHWEIYSYLKNWQFTSGKHVLNSEEELEQLINENRRLLKHITSAFIYHTDKNPNFLGFAALGNRELIFSELNSVQSGQELSHCKPKSEKGLRWLICKMYSLIPRSDLLFTVQKSNNTDNSYQQPTL